ncbi:unnamed protein product [Heterobilharzia americana]|nr:unnamed protein product [Heterobilharzia americana]
MSLKNNLTSKASLDWSGTSFVISSLNDGDKELISYYIMGVSMIGVCCFGLVGNLLSLAVLTRRSVGGSTTNTYLISLAIADMFVLIATILTAVKDSRKPVAGRMSWLVWQDAPIIPRAYPFCHATAILFQVTSVWLTVAFAADRYLMICHPFWAKRWCTLKFAKTVIVVIYVISVIYGIPRYFEYKTFEMYLPLNPVFLNLEKDQNFKSPDLFVQNSSISSAVSSVGSISNDERIGDSMTSISIIWYQLTKFGESDQFRKAYHLWSWVLLVVGIPFVLIAIMNTFLILEVRKSSRKCVDQTKRTEFRRQDTNIMLIGVIVIFFICQLPAAVSHIAWGLITLESSKKMSWFLLNEIGNLLIVVNSAINLLPYYMFSRKFRRHFIRTFWPYRCVRDNGLHCIYIPEWATRSMNNDDDAEESEMAATTTLYTHHSRANVRNYSNYRLSIYRNNSASYRSRPSLPSNVRSSCESQRLFSHIFRPMFHIGQKKSKTSSLSYESKSVKPIEEEKATPRSVLLSENKRNEEIRPNNHDSMNETGCTHNMISNNKNKNNSKSSTFHKSPYRGSNSSVSFQICEFENQPSKHMPTVHSRKTSISDFRFIKSRRFNNKAEVDHFAKVINNCDKFTSGKKDKYVIIDHHNENDISKTPEVCLHSLEEISSNPDPADIL